jgi:flagellar hook-length control protein FliK
MNLESIGIQQGAAQGQAQGAKNAAGNDPLAALFAEFLGLAEALVGDTAEKAKRDEPNAESQNAPPIAIAGTPFLPLPVAAQTAAAAQNGIAAPTAAVTGAKAEAALTEPANGNPGKVQAPSVPGTALPADVPAAGAAAALAPEAPAEAKAQPKPGDAAATAVQPETAMPPLTINLATKVTLAAPKTVAPVGAEKPKPVASSGTGTKSTAPVSVTLEKAVELAPRAEAPQRPASPAPVAAAAPGDAKDQLATAPAKAEPTELAAAPLAPTPAAAQVSPDKATVQPPQAAPMHAATEQVVHRVEKAIEQGEERIRIELSPASLGGVEVQLQIADDGRVSAVVRADRADTLALLQNDVRGLEQALRDAGLRPDAGSLTFNLRQGEGQAGHQPDARGQRRRGNSEAASFAIDGVDGDAAAPRDLLRGLDIRI